MYAFTETLLVIINALHMSMCVPQAMATWSERCRTNVLQTLQASCNSKLQLIESAQVSVDMSELLLTCALYSPLYYKEHAALIHGPTLESHMNHQTYFRLSL